MSNWNLFWKNYRKEINPINENDLLIQVGKTINKSPISKNELLVIVADIKEKLNLNNSDFLLEMCCGNGIVTKKISYEVKKIFAFDFTEHLINSALEFNFKKNIDYKIGDANDNFFNFFSQDIKFQKFLMSFSLGYFTVTQLEQIMLRIINHSEQFSFYLTEVPMDELKWNFYDTKERRDYYIDNLSNDEFNNGMGKWWKKTELLNIAEKFNLIVEFFDLSTNASNYRLNILFRNKN